MTQEREIPMDTQPQDAETVQEPLSGSGNERGGVMGLLLDTAFEQLRRRLTHWAETLQNAA